MSRRKKAAAGSHEGGERWLITYADLITLLLAFFVVMFAISRADSDKLAKVSASVQRALGMTSVTNGGTGLLNDGDGVLTNFAIVQGALETYARSQHIEDSVDVQMRPEGLAIRLSGSLLFRSGSHALTPDAIGVLNRVSQLLRDRDGYIRVEGHTDNVSIATPDTPSNWELSTLRATSVVRHLTEVGGISPARISAAGYGEFRPVADNATRTGRAQNRRVEIVLLNGTNERAVEDFSRFMVVTED